MSLMPVQIMAFGLFDLKMQPKTPSVLAAQKVDTAKAQAVLGAPTGGTLESGYKKEDRTIDHEVTSKRTAYSSTYVNKDGTKTLEISKRQKNYKKGNAWEKINNTLNPVVKSVTPPSLWQSITNTIPPIQPPEEFTSSAGLIDVRMMPLSKGISMSLGDKKIGMKPVGANNVRPEKKDDSSTVYKDAWKGVDLEYKTDGELVKENIIVKQKDVAADYEFNITGAKLIDDPKNPGYFTLQGMQDGFRFGGLTLALKDRGPIAVTNEQITQERTTDNSIKVSLNKEWLASLPESSFPFTIDPSFGRWDADNYDWMFKSDGYACQGYSCWIQAGTLYDNGWKHWRSYVHFPYPELAGKRVLGANVHAYYNPYANPDPNQRYLFFGHASCIGWECRGKHLATVLTAGDFDVNVTNELQLAVSTGNMGATWSFWGEEVPYKTFKTYSDMSLYVVYDTPTPMTTAVDPVDKQVVVNTQPTLRVNPVSDADGDEVKYYYRLTTGADAETGVVVNSGWTTATQWTVPDGILQDGTSYYWHVYTLGATQTNPNWVRSFRVDLRTGKDSTQAYDTVGPVGVDLATGNATTSATTHSIKALGGNIGLSLSYDSPAKSQMGLQGKYWNVSSGHPFGTAPSGDPKMIRNDQNVNFDWPNGSSPEGGINADWFYVKWNGYFVAPTTGSYSFGAVQDDAVSIKVNGQVFSGCPGATPCYNGSPVSLQAGQVVPVEIEYEEATGNGYFRMYVKGPVPEQIVPSEWLRTEVTASQSQYGLSGRYYIDDGSQTFPADSGNSRLMMARNDSKLSFNWGTGGPAQGLQTDNFMVRWTGYVTVPEDGTYTFGENADDGVRVRLNNGPFGSQNTVLDSWNYTGTTVWGSAVTLSKNQAIPITVEYHELGGPASFSLLMKGPGLNEQDIPATWLTPKASALPDSWQMGIDVDGDVNYERLRVVGNNIILEDSTRSTHEYTWTGTVYKPPVNEDGNLVRNSDGTYTLIDTDGRTYIFDAEGKLKSLTSATDDRQPASLKYEYSGDPSRLTKIVDGVTSSRFGTLHYKGVNEDGNCSVGGGFDSAPEGMLCAFRTSDGSVTRFNYKAGQLSQIEKPGADRVNFGYDPMGRLVNTRGSLANDAIAANVRPDNNEVLTELSYDQLGRVSSVKAPAPTVGATRVSHTFEYQTSNMLPLYRMLSTVNGEHRESTSLSTPNYYLEHNQGYLLTSQQPGTHAVFSCQINWDEFTSTYENCEGHSKIGLLGYAYDTPQPNTVQIYRCAIASNGDHFVSFQSNCEGQTTNGSLGHIVTANGYRAATLTHTIGASEPNGFSKKVEYDNLLRTVKETDISNLSTTIEWDSVKDLQLSTTDATGLKSTTIYDADDRPTDSYGPAPAGWYGSDRKPTASYVAQVPHAKTGYDEGITGLAVSVYDNTKLLRTPKITTTGMTNLPYGSYGLGLTNPLVTPTDGLSMRATGKIRLDKVGVYSFKIWHGDGARVYIDDQLINNDWVNGGERFSAVGTYNNTEAGKSARITIESYKNGTSGGGVDGRLFVSLNQLEPGSSTWTEAIGGQYSPSYNLATSTTVYDAQLGNVETKTEYSDPAYGIVAKTTLDPTGLNYQSNATYEAPGVGFLRQTGKTLPGGGTTTYQHYGAEETRDNPCTTEIETIHQAGFPKGKTEQSTITSGNPVSGPTPVVRSVSTGSVSSGALNLTKPTGTANGDLLVMTASGDLSTDEQLSYVVDAGWTQLLQPTRSDASSAGNNLQIWYKIASNEPATYAITPDHSNLIGGSIMRIDGHDATSPIGVSNVTASLTGEALMPSVTTTTDNNLLLRLATWDQSKTLNAIPSGHTASYHVDVNGHDNWGGFKEQATAGSSGVAQFDLSSGAPYVGFTVAINPQTTSGQSQTQPGKVSETVYGASGEVVATRYNNDPWTCTTYDERGRVLQAIIPAVNGNAGRGITNNYAVEGNPLITSTSDNSGVIRVENDLLGRTIKYTDAKGKITESIYDAYGKLTQRTSPLGVETYEFDNYDRAIKYKLDGVTFASITYGALNRIQKIDYPAGMSLDPTSRDSLGRMNKIVFTTPNEAISDEVNRSVSGTVLSSIENGVNKSYVYDKALRLTGANIGGNSYGYEFGQADAGCAAVTGSNMNAGKSGNRTKMTVNGQTTTYCYDQADRLIKSSDVRFTNAQYDSHGNTTSLGDNAHKTEFTYDSSDRNTSIKEQFTGGSKKEVAYERDVQGRLTKRVYKVNDQVKGGNYYGYTGSGDSADFLMDGNGDVVQKYLSLPGGVNVTIKPQSTSAGAVTYSLSNFHGDTMATVNADGLVTSKTISGPFGEKINGQQVPNNTAEGSSWNYLGGFQKNTDTEFAVMPMQMGARVYIAELGRFLQTDPVEGGTDNSYVYVNNPVNDYDLNGQWSLGGFISSIIKTVTRAIVKVAVATVKAVVKVATVVAATVSYVARNVVAPAVSRVVNTVRAAASAVGSTVAKIGRAAGAAINKGLVDYGDAISLGATIVGIGVCAATAGIGCAVAAGVGVAVSAGVAAAQSFDRHKDWRRAGLQAVGSLGLDAVTGWGVGKLAMKVFGSDKGIGRAAIDMNGAPAVFGAGMGLEAGVDWFCDQTKGSVC